MATIIKKIFRFEAAHRVPLAWTKRCSANIHGHSYVVNFELIGNIPDESQMVLDFSLIKKYFGPFVDSLDHAFMHWDRPDNKEELEYVMKNNDRWVCLPFASTAEQQAKMFYWYGIYVINQLRKDGIIKNDVAMHSVEVYETTTGSAKYMHSENDQFPSVWLKDIIFSAGIVADWSPEYKKFYDRLTE